MAKDDQTKNAGADAPKGGESRLGQPFSLGEGPQAKMTEQKTSFAEVQDAGYYGAVSEESERQQRAATVKEAGKRTEAMNRRMRDEAENPAT